MFERMVPYIVLGSSAGAFAYSLHSLVHARLLTVDMAELERLHEQGILSATATLEHDFETLTYLLSTIAPALYMRQAVWVRLYYYTLRLSRVILRGSSACEAEMRRLVAYQAANYRTACARLAEI